MDRCKQPVGGLATGAGDPVVGPGWARLQLWEGVQSTLGPVTLEQLGGPFQAFSD